MPKRQKNLEIKIVNHGAILAAGAIARAAARGYSKFLWDCRVLHGSKSDGGAFGVWDFSVPSFDACGTTRPAAF
jgi:hypothetical protein